MDELRILVADDHPLIRRGLRDLLSARDGWEVVGEAGDGIDAVDMAISLRPNIVILDFSMPGLNGREAAVQIIERLPETGIVFLTMYDSEQVVHEVLHAGARALVLKGDTDRDLLAAVDAVSNDHHFFTTRIAKRILGEHLSGNQNTPVTSQRRATQLTGREGEVMRLLADGMTSKEAAAHLKISKRTIESHRINISRKLGLSSIAELVRYAIRNGIVGTT